VRWQYQRYLKDYLRCITAVDENIGILREALTQRGLLEKSVLAYSSDQGFYLGEHGWYDKRWMYEESLRTPLIVRLPGKAQAGKRVRAMVQNLDYAPTFLELAGAKVPSQMQGLSMLPLLRAGDEKQVPWRRSIYYQYYEFPGAHMVRRHYGVRTERFKLIHYYNLASGSSSTFRRIRASCVRSTPSLAMPRSARSSRRSCGFSAIGIRCPRTGARCPRSGAGFGSERHLRQGFSPVSRFIPGHEARLSIGSGP
jgi:hypothetical protein